MDNFCVLRAPFFIFVFYIDVGSIFCSILEGFWEANMAPKSDLGVIFGKHCSKCCFDAIFS